MVHVPLVVQLLQLPGRVRFAGGVGGVEPRCFPLLTPLLLFLADPPLGVGLTPLLLGGPGGSGGSGALLLGGPGGSGGVDPPASWKFLVWFDLPGGLNPPAFFDKSWRWPDPVFIRAMLWGGKVSPQKLCFPPPRIF